MTDQRERIVIEIDGTGARTGAQQVTDALNSVKRTADGTSPSIKGVGTASDGTGRSLGSMAGAMRGVIAGMASGAVAAFAKSVLDAGIAADSLQRSFVAISGSQSGAADTIAFLRVEADRLGQSFYDLAPAFKSIAASARGTSLEGEQIRSVFSAVTEASTALGLSADDTSGVLRALSQMISKGTVSAEELRGQLGERLPGAFNLAARAMGVSTQELGKMLEQGQILATDMLPKLARELHNAYGAAAETAGLESGQAAVNRLSQEWEDLKTSLYNSRAAVDGINAVSDAIHGLASILETVGAPFAKFYNMVDNIDEAISRVGQGRISFADFATMNGQELADALKESQDNTAKELRTVENNLLQATRDKLSSGAKKEADELRDTYSTLAAKQVGYLNAQLAKSAPGSVFSQELSGQIVAIEARAKELGVTLGVVGGKDQFLTMREGMAAAGNAAQKLLGDAKKANDELSKLTQTPRQKVNAKADELKAQGADPSQVEAYRRAELAKIADAEAKSAKNATTGRPADLSGYGTARLAEIQDSTSREMDILRARQTAESAAADAAYNAGLTSLETYYADRLRLIDAQSGAEISAQEKLIEAAQAEKSRLATVTPTGKNDSARIADQARDLDGKIADAQAKIEVLKIQADQTRAGAIADRAADMRARLSQEMQAAQAVINSTEQSLQSRVITGLETESTARSKLKDVIREQGETLERSLTPRINDALDVATDPARRAELQAMLDKIREMTSAAQTQTWTDGLKQGVEDYATSASDSFQTARDAATSAFSSMEDALVEFASTGKMSVSDMVTSMLADIARLAVRQSITQPLATGLGSVLQHLFSGGSSWTAASVTDSTILGNSGFGRATGGRVDGPGTETSDSIPAMLSAGEYVIKAASARAIGYDALDHVNTHGKLPEKRATGGLISGPGTTTSDSVPIMASRDEYVIKASSVRKLGVASMNYINERGELPPRLAAVGIVGQRKNSLIDRSADRSTLERVIPSIHDHANTIRNTPTPFAFSGLQPFAKGGVFGEAGPEAVMPLTRTSDGRLGVASTGGSSVSVEVNNYSGQQVQTREVQDARGGRKIQVTIGDMVAGEVARHGSSVNKSFRNGFGLRPALVGR